jgi:hypothetical protein
MFIPNAEPPMAKKITHCRLMNEWGILIGSNLTDGFFESNIFLRDYFSLPSHSVDMTSPEP